MVISRTSGGIDHQDVGGNADAAFVETRRKTVTWTGSTGMTSMIPKAMVVFSGTCVKALKNGSSSNFWERTKGTHLRPNPRGFGTDDFDHWSMAFDAEWIHSQTTGTHCRYSILYRYISSIYGKHTHTYIYIYTYTSDTAISILYVLCRNNFLIAQQIAQERPLGVKAQLFSAPISSDSWCPCGEQCAQQSQRPGWDVPWTDEARFPLWSYQLS